ncbi:winged helix-turn-helix transcriptional regulator [Flexibacterium corallicola]|uniref:winged helix-turn-helix transcriptional regulator n=1 Tax=Flexibacterium corallicola TaxID=3037259 RepID=UPI00286ED946|nr:helix-turn-helix domain-containing protein [Pseudovibrio sp. M1P-2-3]
MTATPKISIPQPGQPVRGSKTGAPVMALLDLLGRRWALGVLWVLAENAPCTFNALQAKCTGISPGVLNTRLKELKLANLIEQGESGYALTSQGAELFNMMEPLGMWAKYTWAPTFEESEVPAKK